jgi:hypothetical protein
MIKENKKAAKIREETRRKKPLCSLCPLWLKKTKKEVHDG